METARGRERAGKGWAIKKRPESEEMIWLVLLSSGEGREECKDRERVRKGGKERGSPY